jgi:predicted dehydrogenase
MRYTVTFESNVTADFDISRSDQLILYDGEKAKPISCATTDGWFGEISYFVDCIATAEHPAVVTADDAVQALRVVEAEGRSIAGNRIEPV